MECLYEHSSGTPGVVGAYAPSAPPESSNQRLHMKGIVLMQKPAPSDFPVHDLIRERWSPRAFADKPVPQDVLRSIFEAARWAPSSNNEQPWAYLVATRDDKESFEKALSVLVEFNANWARSAPVLAIAVSKLTFAKQNAPNRNAQYDTGAASALLSVEATARGLAVHQMAGFDPEKARQVFGIPAGWEAIAAIAIGYPGDPASLPPPLKDREMAPRTRKPITEFVMAGHWGHTAPFATK
jgi:nitroreductase